MAAITGVIARRSFFTTGVAKECDDVASMRCSRKLPDEFEPIISPWLFIAEMKNRSYRKGTFTNQIGQIQAHAKLGHNVTGVGAEQYRDDNQVVVIEVQAIARNVLNKVGMKDAVAVPYPDAFVV